LEGAIIAPVTDDRPPVGVRMRRRIERVDTEASGGHHWTAIFRLAEAAEAELHTELGIADVTFGATPRVAVEFDFMGSLRFNDEVDVELVVESLGESSITYAIAIIGPGGTAAEGHITACLIDRHSKRPAPWPDELRRLLTAG
jgi:acyl-CoA thioester hydrolase